MKYRIFTLPIPTETSEETELNGFLASHRVVNVTHDLVMKPDGAWHTRAGQRPGFEGNHKHVR